jgi:two-component system chemotaxis sensor kinase CheA
MGSREIVNLVFLPGFSTAPKVTNVSGRGVGMDVVKTNIEKIGGTIDVQSRVGHGTTFRIKIPLTLAIIPALTVTCADDRYAIPQVNLLELVYLEGEAMQRVERLAGVPVYRLRGRLLPLVFLDEQLGLSPVPDREAMNIVVLSADGSEFGLVVDEVHDTQEIVVKPLSRQLKAVRAFAGATIMGDGRISLILDVPGLAVRAHVQQAARTGKDDTPGAAARPEAEPVLVCQVSGDRRLALPLADVSRVEEVLASSIEQAGTAEVVQYRSELLRLLRPELLLGLPASPPPGYDEDGVELPLTVVVHDRGGEAVGLVVQRIVDVVAEHFAVNSLGRHAGLLGSAIIQEKVTDLLDVPALLAMQEVISRG